MKNNVCLLFTTRNNYQLLEQIFFKYTTADLSKIKIFNIDIDSEPDQKAYAKELFKKYSITNIEIDTSVPGFNAVENNVQSCIDYIDKESIPCDWLLWFSHDCHLIGDDFFQKLDSILEDNKSFKQDVGMIGFCDYNQIQMGKPLYGRGELIKGINEIGKGWYQDLPQSYADADYFIVEAPNDNGLLVNVDLWKKHIIPDDGFALFFWGDDVCAQFGLKGIASITIPSLEMADLYRDKPSYGCARSLTSNSKFHIVNYASNRVWETNWPIKYGFEKGIVKPWQSNPVRQQFLDSENVYEGTVQQKIFNWHINDGPKKLEDIK